MLARYGPFPGPEQSSAFADDGAAWTDWFDGDLMFVMQTGADLDGDGRADAVAVDGGYKYPIEDDIMYQVYFGGEFVEDCPVRTTGTGGRSVPIGDGDGDGLSEVAWDDGQLVEVVAGAGLRGLCDAWLEDASAASIEGPRAQALRAGVGLGDWNADGYDEWLLYDGNANAPGETSVWIYSAAATVDGEFTTADALGSWVCPDGCTTLQAVNALDYDGDGIKELSLWVGGASIIRGGTVPAFGDELPERRLRYDGQVCMDLIPCNGDFTADGRKDLLAITEGEGPQESAWVLPGFEVPWDDSTRW